MNVASISARIGVPGRQVRYAIERVLPGAGSVSRGRGVERQLSPEEAFRVACAALLRAAGLRRGLVERCLGLLQAAPGGSRGWWLEVGDGARARLCERGGSQKHRGVWLDLGTGQAA